MSKVRSPTVMVLRVRVARWSSRPRKLRTGRSVVGGVAGGLALGVGGAGGGGDRVVPGRWVFVGVGQRGQGAAQVPGQVLGEHADQHVGADPVGQVVVDRAQVQVVGLDVAEVAFDVGELLVGARRWPGRPAGWRARWCG